MRHSKLIRSTLAAALFGAGAFLALHSSPLVAGPEFKINFGTPAPEGTPWAQQLVDIKNRVEKESEGRIGMHLFMGGVLGGEVEMVTDILNGGRLHGGGFTTAAVAQAANIPEMAIVELPFLFKDLQEADYVLDNVLYQPMYDKMRAKGLIMTMWAENGWRHFGTRKSVIHNVDDLAQHRMRTQQNEVHQAMYKALGVSAEPLPNTEILNALKTGMVDGFDNSTLFAQAAGLTEAIKYWTYSQHIYQPASILYSREVWEKMPPELQKVLKGNRIAETAKGRAMVRSLEEVLRQNMIDMKIEVYDMSVEERKTFAEKTKVVHDDFAKKYGRELLDIVYAAQKEYRAGK